MTCLRRVSVTGVLVVGLGLLGQLACVGTASAMTKAELVAVLGDRAVDVSVESPLLGPVPSAGGSVNLGGASVGVSGQ